MQRGAGPPDRPAAAPPAARRPGILAPLGWIALALLLLAGALAGGAAWLLRSDGGTTWLLQRVPGLAVEGWRGALLGDAIEVERLSWGGTAAAPRLRIDGLQARGLRWTWRPQPGVWVGLEAEAVEARRAAWRSGPAAPAQPPPDSLASPLRLDLRRVAVGLLEVDALPPLRALQAALQIGADGGAAHALRALSVDVDRWRVQGELRVGSAAPLPAQVRLGLQGLDGQGWSATLQADGPLQQLAIVALLRGPAPAGGSAPALDLRARVSPFAAWPLVALSATTNDLDLAALWSGAPATRLSGQAQVRSSAADAPLDATIEIDNRMPGAWNDGRLPLQRLGLVLRATAAQRDRVELQAFDLDLGDGQRDGGRFAGRGMWLGTTLRLEGQVDRLQPQRLDARAAPMLLTGPLTLVLRGLPSPDPAAPAAPTPWSVQAEAALEGRLAAAPQPVRLRLVGQASDGRIEVSELQAGVGGATARGRGSMQRDDARRVWKIASDGRLQDFDPRPWWPGAAADAWARGPHRLNAQWKLALDLPTDGGAAPWRRSAGSAAFDFAPSLLAGVPLRGRVGATKPPTGPADLQGDLWLAGNHALFSAQGDLAGDGRADRWKLDLQAPELAALAPLVRLLPGDGAWTPARGALQASIDGRGRWPALQAEGTLQLRELRSAALAADRARVDLRFGATADAPLDLRIEAEGLAQAGRRIDRLRAAVQGTLRRHRLEAVAVAPLKPPPALTALLETPVGSGSTLRLHGEAGYDGVLGRAGVWRARLAQVAAGPNVADAEAAWLDARDLQLEGSFDAAGAPQRLELAPGTTRVAGRLPLRWERLRVDFGAARPRFEFDGGIDPVELAPWLARSQPDFGWGGDLRVALRASVRAGEQLDADVVLERIDGDLTLRSETTTQRLGLSDLRLGLSAHGGTWHVTQALAGRNLGETAGAVTLRLPATQWWPEPATPLEGVLELRVANLGAWGAWVPAGWRLSGALHTSASIGGRLGAPEYTGRVVGQGVGVRNLLLGVDLRDGDIDIALQGTRASIRRFELRGGEGRLRLDGSADLGAEPRARLTVDAQRFQALGRIDRRISVTGRADLALGVQAMKLDGRFRIDEGLIDFSQADAPSLDDDVVVRRSGRPAPARQAAAAAAPVTMPTLRQAQVALDLDLGDRLRLRGRGLDALLRGELKLATPGGQLALRGTVRAESGTYAAYGQKLAIERGLVAFAGAVGNPRLDILALRPDIDTRVGVAVSGTAQSPRVRLYSEPEMTDTDKLSWLVLGRAPDALGRTDTALLQRAAMALLAGEGGSRTDQLLRRIGLDELSLRQSDGDVQETVITIGKRLSQRWYLGYERGVNATTGTWQLIYRIAQRFTLRAQSGAENSLDLIWSWRWQ